MEQVDQALAAVRHDAASGSAPASRAASGLGLAPEPVVLTEPLVSGIVRGHAG